MSQKEKLPEFSRQNLRKATKFVEGDYSGINPRSFYRKLKRSIEEIQEGDDFKYTTEGTQERDLEISSEEVGEKTGTVKGRLSSISEWREIGTGQLEYRPYGPHGALGIVIGAIFLLLGISGAGTVWTVLGIVGVGGGTYGYWQKEQETFPILRQDMIRVLITGEVSERTTESGKHSQTDIFANMSVVFAGDAFVGVDIGSLEELEWTFRRNLENQVRRWHNQVVETDREEVTVESGFMWELKGFTDRDVQVHRKSIDDVQKNLIKEGAPFEYRLDYSDLLKEQLPPETKADLETHEAELMLELEELAENLDIYVEREGLEHTNKVEQRQGGENPQLDAGNED